MWMRYGKAQSHVLIAVCFKMLLVHQDVKLLSIMVWPLTSHTLNMQPLMEAGVDSLSAIELGNAIGKHFNTNLPTTLIFDYPSISSIATFLASQAVVETQVALAVSEMHPKDDHGNQPSLSLILGIACRYPKGMNPHRPLVPQLSMMIAMCH